jgi:hypothetical protein
MLDAILDPFERRGIMKGSKIGQFFKICKDLAIQLGCRLVEVTSMNESITDGRHLFLRNLFEFFKILKTLPFIREKGNFIGRTAMVDG